MPRVCWRCTQPGKINVVEFADYECPFCRLLHDRLKAIIKDYPGKVNFVRLNMPLQSHPSARHAARAGLCAEAQGKGDAMADRLFSAEDLSPAANRRAAAELGLDVAEFERCVASPDTDKKIDAAGQDPARRGISGVADHLRRRAADRGRSAGRGVPRGVRARRAPRRRKRDSRAGISRACSPSSPGP